VHRQVPAALISRTSTPGGESERYPIPATRRTRDYRLFRHETDRDDAPDRRRIPQCNFKNCVLFTMFFLQSGSRCPAAANLPHPAWKSIQENHE
jgi:hypothetical protein